MVDPIDTAEDDTKIGNIIVPGKTGAALTRMVKAIIVDASPDVIDLKVGDVVVYKRLREISINVQNKRYVLLEEKDIVGTYPA